MLPAVHTVAILTVLSAVAAAPAQAQAPAPPPAPTAAQIRTAVKRAERSRDLWATVNICHTPRFGIRGQMPALGFPTRMSMRIQVEYYNFAKRRYMPDQHAHKKIRLGLLTRDLHQDGFIWQFEPIVILSGSVTFEWRLGNKLIGRATRSTSHRASGVDHTDPKGNSTATCSLR